METNDNNTTNSTTTGFNGKYRLAMSELYGFLTLCEVAQDKAVKICHMFACDFGAAVKAGQTEVTAKVGKMSKEQLGSLTDTLKTKTKGTFMTVPLQLAHCAQWAGEAGKHGILYGKTQWELSIPLRAWINVLEVKQSPVEQTPVEQAEPVNS